MDVYIHLCMYVSVYLCMQTCNPYNCKHLTLMECRSHLVSVNDRTIDLNNSLPLQCTGKQFVILDTPLLFESGKLVSWMKRIVVVYW